MYTSFGFFKVFDLNPKRLSGLRYIPPKIYPEHWQQDNSLKLETDILYIFSFASISNVTQWMVLPDKEIIENT